MANPGIVNSGEGYVIFLIAGKEYGINVKTLYSIINPLDDFSLRYSFSITKDSLRINDEEIPFINFYDLQNIKTPAQSKDTRIIIVNIEEHIAAFYVEKVKEFISLDTKGLVQLEFITIPDKPLIKSKIKCGDRYFLLPDFYKILTATI